MQITDKLLAHSHVKSLNLVRELTYSSQHFVCIEQHKRPLSLKPGNKFIIELTKLSGQPESSVGCGADLVAGCNWPRLLRLANVIGPSRYQSKADAALMKLKPAEANFNDSTVVATSAFRGL